MVDGHKPKNSGYARVRAISHARQIAPKQIFGKRKLKYRECFVAAVHFLQMGSVLGVKYRNKLPEFGHAFLGAPGAPDSMGRLVYAAAPDAMSLVTEEMDYTGYVTADQMKKGDYQRESEQFLGDMEKVKFDIETSAVMFKLYAMRGSILGVAHPETARLLFANTYGTAGKAERDEAREAGQDLPESQEIITWDEVEEAETELFLAYCQECAPSLYEALR